MEGLFVPQIKFYKYTNKKMSFFNVYPSRANKNNFPRHKYTNKQPRTKKTLHPSFVYLCIRLRAEKITEKPWAEGTLIFLDMIP